MKRVRAVEKTQAPPKKKSKKAVSIPFGHDRDRLEAMQRVMSLTSAWKPAGEVMECVEAVPTIFPQYNVKTRVGGHPNNRVCLVHGPSGHGKSAFCLGLGLSYLLKGHFFGFVDAERTTPRDWVERLMGDAFNRPGFGVLPSSSFEAVRDGVKNFVETIGNAREKGELPKDVRTLIVVDSIRKLVPNKLMKALDKEIDSDNKFSGGMDGMRGMAGMYKAALNTVWMDELVQLLADTKSTMSIITRERPNPNAEEYDEEDYIIQGGGGLVYDSSLRLRVTHNRIRDPEAKKEGSGVSKGAVLGERCSVGIHKSKIGEVLENVPRANFFLSNGKGAPFGFDRARDVLEMAQEVKVIEMTGGAWYRWGEEKLGQGEIKALDFMRANPDMLQEIEQRTTAAMREKLGQDESDG